MRRSRVRFVVAAPLQALFQVLEQVFGGRMGRLWVAFGTPADLQWSIEQQIEHRGGVPEWSKGSDCKSDG